jgi:Uma2 family endonuclease
MFKIKPKDKPVPTEPKIEKPAKSPKVSKVKTVSPKEQTIQLLRETPPDLVLELLVPNLTDQLLKRRNSLIERRDKIEERLTALYSRREDALRVARGEQPATVA